MAEKKSADVPSTIHIVFSDSEGEEEKKAGRDASQQPAVDETVREKDKKKKRRKRKRNVQQLRREVPSELMKNFNLMIDKVGYNSTLHDL